MSRKHFIEEAAYKAALSLKDSLDANPRSRANCQEFLPEINIARKRILFAFKKITGCNFIAYQRYKRVEAAADMLLSGTTIKEVTITCGYNGYVGNFSRDFKAVFSKGPDEWLKNRAGNGNKSTSNKVVIK
jgi:AraC-like DNA-binding protein